MKKIAKKAKKTSPETRKCTVCRHYVKVESLRLNGEDTWECRDAGRCCRRMGFG